MYYHSKLPKKELVIDTEHVSFIHKETDTDLLFIMAMSNLPILVEFHSIEDRDEMFDYFTNYVFGCTNSG